MIRDEAVQVLENLLSENEASLIDMGPNITDHESRALSLAIAALKVPRVEIEVRGCKGCKMHRTDIGKDWGDEERCILTGKFLHGAAEWWWFHPDCPLPVLVVRKP